MHECGDVRSCSSLGTAVKRSSAHASRAERSELSSRSLRHAHNGPNTACAFVLVEIFVCLYAHGGWWRVVMRFGVWKEEESAGLLRVRREVSKAESGSCPEQAEISKGVAVLGAAT
eukprot:6208552-Pleurochrysis_carterae.AAC.3